MNSENNPKPAIVLPPGAYISELLADRGWTQMQLAELTGRPVQTINGIVRGRREITPETALQLAAAFGSSDTYFMNMEVNYRMWLAEQKQAVNLDAIRSRVKEIEDQRGKAS